jgi:anti-sigma regulatory factor (Ser/Thr protein kinase)
MSHRFERTITNELHNLETLMHATTSFLEDNGVDAQAVYQTNLTLEEMVTNIIKYGYDDYDTHNIVFSMEVTPGEIVAVLEDDGHEFDPVAHAASAATRPVDAEKAGGMGINLILKTVKHMAYWRENGKNILEIRIQRGVPAA